MTTINPVTIQPLGVSTRPRSSRRSWWRSQWWSWLGASVVAYPGGGIAYLLLEEATADQHGVARE